MFTEVLYYPWCTIFKKTFLFSRGIQKEDIMEVDNDEPDNSDEDIDAMCDWNCNAPGDEEFTQNCTPQKSISGTLAQLEPSSFYKKTSSGVKLSKKTDCGHHQQKTSDNKKIKKPFTFEADQQEEEEDKDMTDTSHEETDVDDYEKDEDYTPQQEHRKVTSTPKPAAATPKKKSKGLWTEQKLQLLCTLWEDEQFLYDASHPDYRKTSLRVYAYQRIAAILDMDGRYQTC